MHLRLAKWAALPLLVIFIGAGQVKAQNAHAYTFVLGSGFLCDPVFSACPATAKASRGDSYEFSGAGAFDLQAKSVKAAGTFTHKATNGLVLETGVWIANEMVSFVSYGTAPGALLRERSALSPMQFDPKHMKIRMLSAPMPTGGLGVFRVALLSTSGVSRNATLQLNCALGEVPSEHSVEGIQLMLEGNQGEFSESVGGRVAFLAMPAVLNRQLDHTEPAAPGAGDPQVSNTSN